MARYEAHTVLKEIHYSQLTKEENLRGGHNYFENKKKIIQTNKQGDKDNQLISSLNPRACRCHGLFLSKTKYANLPALLVS